MSTTLIDLTEVAAILNVTVSTARRYRIRYRYPTRSRDQFPSPVTYVGVSPMWLRADIAAWHEGATRCRPLIGSGLSPRSSAILSRAPKRHAYSGCGRQL